MQRTRIYTGRGFEPYRGTHPVIIGLVIIYIILVIYILIFYGLKNTRFTGPGPLLIYLAYRRINSDSLHEISVYIDREYGDNLFFGYRNIKNNKEKEYGIKEYSYWYYNCKGTKGKNKGFEQVMKIVTTKDEIVYLTEETDEPVEKWTFHDIAPDPGTIIIPVSDLLAITAAIDQYSS